MPGLIKFTASLLWQRKLRSFLTVLGIILGTALIFSIQITKQTAVSSLAGLYSDLSGSSDIQVTGASSAGFPETKVNDIRNVKGVRSVAPALTRLTFVIKNNQKQQVQLLGINPKTDVKFRGYKIVSGRFLDSGTSEKEVVLVKSWAEDMNIKLGSNVNITTSNGIRGFKAVGFIAKTGPGNVYDGALATIDLKVAQQNFMMPRLVNQVDIKISNNFKTGLVIKKLQSKLGESYIIERPQSKGSAIETTTQGLMQAFNTFALLALLVGAFVVFNTMSMSISERRKQIGLLRAIGATRGQIIFLIIVEAIIFGLIGSLAGLAVGKGLATFISGATAQIYKTVVDATSIPFERAVLVVAIGITASVFAALAPAWQASSTSPISAVKEELLKGMGWVERKGWVLGFLFVVTSAVILFLSAGLKANIEFFNLAMIILFIGVALVTVKLIGPLTYLAAPAFTAIFKLEGYLAKQNVMRNKSRSALSAVIITMGLVLVIAAGALAVSDKKFVSDWLDSVVRVDLFVRTPVPFNTTATGAYPRMNLSLGEKIKKIEGVKFVSPVTFQSTRALGRDIFTIFTVPANWKKTSRLSLDEGDPDEVLKKLEKPENVLITSTIRTKHDLHIGDKLTIKTAKGDVSFNIVGVIPELANDGYTVYLSRQTLYKYFNTRGVDTFNILAKKGSDINKLKKILREKIGNPNGLLVISGLDLRKDINKSVNQFLSMLNSMALIAVLVSALGIINTLSMNVMERIREIGMLRAVGMTRLQISKTIIAEGGIIGIIGGLLGITLGLAVSRVIIVIANLNSGFPLKYYVPYGSIAVSAVIAVIVSVTASIYPAYKAAKVNVVKAVQYE